MRLRETNMNFVRISDSEFNLDTISWVTPRLAASLRMSIMITYV